MSTAEKKLSLLERIMRLPYNEQWEKLELMVSKIEEDITKEETAEERLARFAKPIKKSIDIEALIEEQNYQGYDDERAEAIVKEMNIQEPIEDLLNMI